MLVTVALIRASGLLEAASAGLHSPTGWLGLDARFVNALPTDMDGVIATTLIANRFFWVIAK